VRGRPLEAILEVESTSMATYVEAVFEHGAFVPETPLNLPEGTRVVLTVSPRPGVEPPTVTDPRKERGKTSTPTAPSKVWKW
jgi:predicted DNA-binding antitoxin AbrB/MazE fold protein